MSDDPFRLTVSVQHADGTETRWAADESDPANQPQGLSFSTVLPGGFGDYSLTLARDLIAHADENLLDSIVFRGPGGEIAYEGRVHRLPRARGGEKTLTVQGTGWSSHLSDFRAFREIYRDCDLTRWTGELSGANVTRLIAATLIPRDNNPGVIREDSGSPYLALGWANQAAWTTPYPYSAATYRSGGIPIGSVYYAWKRVANLSSGGTSWNWGVQLATDDTMASFDNTADLEAAGPGAGTLTATTSGRTYAQVELYYGAAGGAAELYRLGWTSLAVYGNHGLTKRGTEPAAGYYCSDIITNVIQRAAPRLNIGQLDDSGFIIEQCAYQQQPTTAGAVILDVNRFDLYDWFVWEDREFTRVNPDPQRLTWNVRLGSGIDVGLEGDDVVELASSAYVYYTDQYGVEKVYGPTGATGCTLTSDYLLGDGSDPYTQQGIDAPLVVELTDVHTDALALQVGMARLAENNAPQRSGEIKISGMVDHPTEGPVPCWKVRAGDYLQITDKPGGDAPRKIVQTRYDHATRTVTCTVGSGPLYRLDGLLARMGVRAGVLGV